MPGKQSPIKNNAIEKANEYAVDGLKLFVTLSSTILAFTVTFLKDILAAFAVPMVGIIFLGLAWVSLIVTIASSLMGIIGASYALELLDGKKLKFVYSGKVGWPDKREAHAVTGLAKDASPQVFSPLEAFTQNSAPGGKDQTIASNLEKVDPEEEELQKEVQTNLKFSYVGQGAFFLSMVCLLGFGFTSMVTIVQTHSTNSPSSTTPTIMVTATQSLSSAISQPEFIPQVSTTPTIGVTPTYEDKPGEVPIFIPSSR